MGERTLQAAVICNDCGAEHEGSDIKTWMESHVCRGDGPIDTLEGAVKAADAIICDALSPEARTALVDLIDDIWWGGMDSGAEEGY